MVVLEFRHLLIGCPSVTIREIAGKFAMWSEAFTFSSLLLCKHLTWRLI